MGFGAVQTLVGVTKLSELGIDVSQDWLGYLIKNLGDPVAAQDATTRAYVLAQLANYLALAGGTMSGAIAMGTSKITGLGTPTLDYDASTKKYVDDSIPSGITATQSQPVRDFAIVYQNTSGKVRMVVFAGEVIVRIAAGATHLDGTSVVYAFCDSDASPTTQVATSLIDTKLMLVADPTDEQLVDADLVMSFLVPNNYYYEITREYYGDGLEPILLSWTEYDIG